VGAFIATEPRLSLVTVHTYPLQRCYTPLVSMTYPTIDHLLAGEASRGLAGKLAATARTAHAHGLPVRVDEINTVSCGGARGVSNTFASALWALDTMFSLAGAGVDGVNVHTYQSATYRLFKLERGRDSWRAAVAPEYYGLLLFAQAAPSGSRLLRVSGGAAAVRAWATRERDGTIHIVVINDDTARSHVVVIRGLADDDPAAYEALRARGARATGGISLGGASFGALSDSGVLPPARRIVARPVGGAYVLRLSAASAVMLTVPSGRPA
jgi:hypothetical protein